MVGPTGSPLARGFDAPCRRAGRIENERANGRGPLFLLELEHRPGHQRWPDRARIEHQVVTGLAATANRPGRCELAARSLPALFHGRPAQPPIFASGADLVAAAGPAVANDLRNVLPCAEGETGTRTRPHTRTLRVGHSTVCVRSTRAAVPGANQALSFSLPFSAAFAAFAIPTLRTGACQRRRNSMNIA